MSKKYFVVADVHGFYDEMMFALNEAGFDINNPEHIIISAGDATDRGDKPREVLEFLMDLYGKGRAILIRGNHEDLMVQAIWRGGFQSHDVHNGTVETAKILTGEKSSLAACFAMKDCKLFWDYYDATIDYYETDNAVFVHGWIPYKMVPVEGDRYKSLPELYRPRVSAYDEDWRNGDWEDARWQNGMRMWEKGIRVPGKTVYCGHWRVDFGHKSIHKLDMCSYEDIVYQHDTLLTMSDEEYAKQMAFASKPFIDDGIVALDATTCLTHRVNVFVI